MRGCADFIRQDKADAGKGYGAFSMWRSFAWILRSGGAYRIRTDRSGSSICGRADGNCENRKYKKRRTGRRRPV